MQAKFRKEDKFKKRLQKTLAAENLQQQRELIQRIVSELNVDLLDCAAALVYLSQPNLYQAKPAVAAGTEYFDFEIPPYTAKKRTVRYRLEVGSRHQVKADEIKDLLVEESGVDRNRIGRVDIRHDHTIVELPDGMPGDIFQLLGELQIHQQQLNIKRLKAQRKFRRSHKPV